MIREFELKHGNVSKENMPLPAGYYSEKDDSRFLIGKEITEHERMIGILQWK